MDYHSIHYSSSGRNPTSTSGDWNAARRPLRIHISPRPNASSTEHELPLETPSGVCRNKIDWTFFLKKKRKKKEQGRVFFPCWLYSWVRECFLRRQQDREHFFIFRKCEEGGIIIRCYLYYDDGFGVTGPKECRREFMFSNWLFFFFFFL